MIASAPGKLVLSGAYVVLDSAPAVVAAVGRYAVADSARQASFVSEELRAAFGDSAVPHVDTMSMRSGGRKLGLGSSAAAVVATLAVSRLAAPDRPQPPRLQPADLDAIERQAYLAHRRAQGGGSGIDVVASTRGGILRCTIREGEPPHSAPLVAPVGLVLEAWVCPESGSTPSLLRGIKTLRQARPAHYDALVAPAVEGAHQAADGFAHGNIDEVLAGAQKQLGAMMALGDTSGCPIIPNYLRALAPLAEKQGGLIAQAGAGGGDIALYFGAEPTAAQFRQEATSLGLRLLPLVFGCHGAKAGYPALPSRA